MKPSSFKTRRISSLILEDGNTTRSWCARDAFRKRVSMSPTGSLTTIAQPPSRGPPANSSHCAFRAYPGGSHQLHYHEDLMTPVISPDSARLRRQMRHIWNLRKNARGL